MGKGNDDDDDDANVHRSCIDIAGEKAAVPVTDIIISKAMNISDALVTEIFSIFISISIGIGWGTSTEDNALLLFVQVS